MLPYQQVGVLMANNMVKVTCVVRYVYNQPTIKQQESCGAQEHIAIPKFEIT